MGSRETSRTVTRARCASCGAKFKASRRDARYCSGRCVLEGEAQFVDEAGNVWIRSKFASHTRPPARGGAAWVPRP